jgi:hypothetical protein
MEPLYRRALSIYREISARRGEAESLIILGRLHGASDDDEIAFDPAAADLLLQAAQILERIGRSDLADTADKSIDELITATYSMREYGSEHRIL